MGKKKGGGGGKPKRDDWEADMTEVIAEASTPAELAEQAAKAEEAAAEAAEKAAREWAERKLRVVVSEVAGEGAGRTKHRVELKASDSLVDLGVAIAGATGVAVGDQVVIYKGKRLDLVSEAASGVCLTDADIANQSKLSLMTVANAAAAAADAAEPTEPLLLVALDVASGELDAHEAAVAEACAELDAIAAVLAAANGAEGRGDSEGGGAGVGAAAAGGAGAAAGAAGGGGAGGDAAGRLTRAHRRLMQCYSDAEKLQLRLDALRIPKKLGGVREARRPLIERASALLDAAEAAAARAGRAQAAQARVAELVALLAEHPDGHAGRDELNAGVEEARQQLAAM